MDVLLLWLGYGDLARAGDGEEMSEHITHEGGHWGQIARDLTGEQEFAWHLIQKSTESCRQFGPERPFGETVTEEQAGQIRRSAKARGYREHHGDAG